MFLGIPRRLVVAVAIILAMVAGPTPAGAVQRPAVAVTDVAPAPAIAAATPATMPPAATVPPAAARVSAPPAASQLPDPSAQPPPPATVDRPVPADLRPTLAEAAHDYPAPYLDRCHVQHDGRISPTASCFYGDLESPTTIVLFGDSHALSWFPAALRVAKAHGWRLQVLTMSTCTPADIPAWNPALARVTVECAAWRQRTLRLIEAEGPAIVLVAGTRGFATVDASRTVLAGDARTDAWRAGMRRTLDTLVAAAGTVIVLGDVPLAAQDPPPCLAAHPTSVLACATPFSVAVDTVWRAVEEGSAAASGAGFVDPTAWVCPTVPCPVVIGNVLVFRDHGHLTSVFVSTLGGRLDAAIVADLRRSLDAMPPS